MGQSPILRSDGNYIREYVYARDVSSAYLTLAEKISSTGVVGECFNFSLETQVMVLEIVHKIRKAMNREDVQPTIINTAKGEIRNQYFSPAKARRVLGWKPAYSFEQGLEESVAWYRDFLHSQGL